MKFKFLNGKIFLQNYVFATLAGTENLITSFIIILEQLTLLNLLAGAGTYVKKLLVYRYQY